MASKAWPYEEARKLLKRYPDGKPGGAPVVFETGYGPSGLPHLGTFTEVVRTLWVKHAFSELSDQPSELIAVSDDMDGMRKVPPGLPEQAMLAENLDKPLCRVPDPWGCHDSFAAHNNAALRKFLDDFGFAYTFVAASDAYASGRFDDALRSVLANYDAIMGVMLPTLGAERRRTYSPVLPIDAESGRVLQVPLEGVDAAAGTVRYRDGHGEVVEQSILGGRAKLQWKVDWAMRWVALGVDYEMAGKDLIDSVVQSSKIARVLGGRPPEGFNYGASPAELARADVSGRSAVLLSGNGPRALSVTNGARHVLLGSFYNADAVVAQAAALAKTEVALVCTGLDGDEDLDDTLCAGYLAAQLRRRLPGAQLGGGALFALSLLRAFPSPVSALWQSRSGHHLRRLDLTGDLAVGSLVSQTDAVPRLTERGEDLYLFTAAPPAD